jgi:signal transduction histidine kinase
MTVLADRAQVAVHAPTGRDGSLTVEILEHWGLRAQLCVHVEDLCGAIGDGVGVLLIAEETLIRPTRDKIIEALARQPSWSDIPVIILTGEGELSRTITQGIEAVAERGNVMLLERPIRIATLVTAVRSALRARERQYEIRDYVAERDRLLDSERRARADAEEANRAKSEFLAVMSHELRTPLNAIAGYADLIDLEVHGTVTAAQREAIRRIQRSERHLLGLIEGVLNFARVETGKVEYHLAPVAVNHLIATAEELVLPQVRGRGLTLTIGECNPSLSVTADDEKAKQVLLNLLSNAIKFTHRGGEIRMRCRRQDRCAELSVEDTGVGVAADKLQRIFEPFVQVDSRLTRTQQGVGLGLAISRELARGMGGDLRVESEPGLGSRFTFSLPLAEGDRMTVSKDESSVLANPRAK